ncbi:MAG: hypothetical protein ABIX01_06020 [Chitinophagaceae bacterium]
MAGYIILTIILVIGILLVRDKNKNGNNYYEETELDWPTIVLSGVVMIVVTLVVIILEK